MEGTSHLRRRIAAPLLVALFALSAGDVAAAKQSPAVVTVNDPAGAVTVTRAELEHWVEVARRSSGVVDRTTKKRVLQSQALQLLISFAWIEGEARAQGLTVTDAEARQSFETQKQQSFR